MLDGGTVHLGGELQKSLQILDQAVDISTTTFRPELKRRVASSLKAGYDLVEFYNFSL